jgi:hypothetical protein
MAYTKFERSVGRAQAANRGEEAFMRRISAAFVLAAALLGAQSVAASADDPFSFAVGGGHRGLSLMNRTAQGPPFALSAHLGPHGAFGEYNSNANNGGVLDFRGDVTFLIVGGNAALICGVVRHAAIPEQEGTGFAVAVVDNGPPGSVTPDLISLTNVSIPVPQSQTDCEANSFLFLPFLLLPVVDGNITVEDAAS